MEAQGKLITVRKKIGCGGFVIPAGSIVKVIDHPTISHRYSIVGGQWDTWSTIKENWEIYNDPSILPPELFEI